MRPVRVILAVPQFVLAEDIKPQQDVVRLDVAVQETGAVDGLHYPQQLDRIKHDENLRWRPQDVIVAQL